MSEPARKQPESPTMLKRYLLTASIAAVAFIVSFVLRLAVGNGTSGASFYIGGVLFYTTFLLTPLIFLLGAIGTLSQLVRSRERREIEHSEDKDRV